MAKSKSRANGDGTFYYSQSKKLWVGQITVGVQSNGNLKRVTKYGKTRKEVKSKIEKFKLELGGREIPNKNGITLIELMKQMAKQSYELNEISDSTYYQKKTTIKQFENYDIAYKPIQRIAENDVIDFYKSITIYSNSIIEKLCGLLKATLKEAMHLNIVYKNVAEYVKRPKSDKPNKKVIAFTIEEQKKLIKALSTDPILYKKQILLSLYTGMRMGEVDALLPDVIDLNNSKGRVKRTITKDKDGHPILGNTAKTLAGERTLIFNVIAKEILIEALNEMKENKYNLIFLNKNNEIVTTSHVNNAFKRFCKKHNIGKDVNQHMLRHTYATRCIESGMPATVLQKILGHTDISTTLNTYCDVFAEYERKSVDNSYEYFVKCGLIL